jgi:hypothetical protein
VSVQGTEEWLLERCGHATASEFASVLASGTERKMRTGYLRRLVAERLTGKPTETYSKTVLMEHAKFIDNANRQSAQ